MESTILSYAMYSVSSLLTPIILKQGMNCLNNIHKPPNKCKKSLLLIPRQCYKSALCEKLNQSNHEILFIDVDDMIKSHASYEKAKCLKGYQRDLLLKDLYKGIYGDLKKKFVKGEKKKIVMVSSEIQILTSFYQKHVFVCMPSTDLVKQLLVNLDSNPELKEQSIKSYQKFLFYLQKDSSISVFENFDQLVNIIVKSYQMKYLSVL